jgi:hypothetical protein
VRKLGRLYLRQSCRPEMSSPTRSPTRWTWICSSACPTVPLCAPAAALISARERACRLPRLSTPEREGFERFRRRRQQQLSGPEPEPEYVVGSDPVEGDPATGALHAMYDESGIRTPTEEERAQADAEFEGMLGKQDNTPDGFGDGIDKFI